ncbi:hypothetical protein [Paenibacillus sp. H1-7]|nr:hypothetical protein [Paenibacillus sp. H1-7]
MYPAKPAIKEIVKGSGFKKIDILLKASEQLRTSASATTAVAAAK